MIETRLQDGYPRKSVVTHETEMLELEAKVAFDLAIKWGMVSAMSDGEDSSGRQKLRLMTPAELADRAFETAEHLLNLARDRGQIHTAPSMAEIIKEESKND